MVSPLFLGLDPWLFLKLQKLSAESKPKVLNGWFCSHCYLPSAQLLYKLNKNGCADSTITNHQPLCFCDKDTVVDVYSSALQPAFSHLRNSARSHLSLQYPLPDAVAHTFVQSLCLVLFRWLKCSSFCWSPYQHNPMTAAGTELTAMSAPWHQTRSAV